MHADVRTPWLRSFMQPVTFIGLGMIAFVIASVSYLLEKDRADAIDAAQRSGANLAQMFEGYMSRSLKSIDTTMRVLRSAYLQNPNLDIVAWARNPDLHNDLVVQISIIGPDGFVKMSTSDVPLKGHYVGDRELFRVHRDSQADTVFVSKPLVLRTRNKWAITMSRRIEAADGSFAGIVSVVIDPLQLQRFYSELDLGSYGIASLIGFDGVIRARGGRDNLAYASIGRSVGRSPVMQRYQDAPRGTYWNIATGGIDGIDRLITYRVVDGFPLIAIVGLARSDIYSHAEQNARIYFAISGAVVLVLLGVIGFAAARQRKLLSIGAEIVQLAHYDGLTGLANRALFLQRVSAAVGDGQDGRRFAVHLLDLDRFKEVNDTLGHAFGDALLKAAAERIRAAVPAGDVVARLGGDEFAILQALPHGSSGALELAEKLLTVMREPFRLGDHQVNVETSIGIALAPDHGQEAEQLLKTADLALYKAKSEGRNTLRQFRPEMEMQARARHALEIDLRNAIASHAFELHYQPIVSTPNKIITGVEALVRWRHPQRGLVQPDDFIPLAEETGLIVPLGEWVLRQACADAVSWPDHITLSVNLSSLQFRQGNLMAMVTGALAQSGLPASRLELEVTETVLLDNNDENLALLHQFRGLGISIALDDFGTGYSSLSYLQRFPFDKIKIDRSFVANLTTRADCVAIVSAVTGLARALDITTTAEGVETEEQFLLLLAAGCSHAQGFLFGKPRHKDDLGFQWVEGLRVA